MSGHLRGQFRHTSITCGNGTSTTYLPDPVSRLDTLKQNFPGGSDNLSLKFTYNPASQIASVVRSNDAYAWRGGSNRNTPYSVNGLNQATAAGGTGIGYDARGDTTSIGGATYTYGAENMLLIGPLSAALVYDPLARLYQTSRTATTRLQYDGLDTIGEYNAGNALQRRYVFGPGTDEPLVWYEGAGTGDRRWLHADERGSVIAVTNGAGARIATNSYDEYGVPAAGNSGRFGYTGQAWLPELGMWYYKARMYAPAPGRFMQTDPIGYADGMNWYGYTHGDPVNATDPLGLDDDQTEAEVVVNGKRLKKAAPDGSNNDIIVTAQRAVARIGARGRAVRRQRELKPTCPAPLNVSLTGTIVTAPVGPAYFSGTLTDVSTGRTYAVSAFGYGGGFVAGTYDVTATVRGFNALSNGLDIAFAQGPFGSGGAMFSDNNGNTIGEGSVSGGLAPPIGAGGASFDPPILTQTNAGKCQ